MPATSKAQARAMFSAAAGNSTLGIPKSVGKEFSQATEAKGSKAFGKLPEKKEKKFGELPEKSKKGQRGPSAKDRARYAFKM